MRERGDAHPSWIWVEALAATGDSLTLDPDAAHHVGRVWRAREGDALTLTDGAGGVARARVSSVRPEVSVVIETREQREPPPPLVMLCGAPEGDRADWMIEKLAELGATLLVPIESSRSEWRATPSRRARWSRLTRAALEQSCGAFRMSVSEPAPLATTLAELSPGLELRLAEPGGSTELAFEPAGLTGIAIAIGPASGFDGADRSSLIARGFRPMALGRSRLRAETAAVLAAGLARAREASGSTEA